MTDLDAFLPNIRPYAPGVADPVAYEWIRQAAIEFCERTRLWRHEEVFDLSGENPETLVAPDGAEIHEIERVDFNGEQLTPASPAQLDVWAPDWREGLRTGTPQWFTQTEVNAISLAPLGEGVITVAVWLKPAQGAEEVPDFMASQYRQVIADGALARILMIPGQSFTNNELAGVFAGRFEMRLAQLFAKGLTGQQRARIRTRGTFF